MHMIISNLCCRSTAPPAWRARGGPGSELISWAVEVAALEGLLPPPGPPGPGGGGPSSGGRPGGGSSAPHGRRRSRRRRGRRVPHEDPQEPRRHQGGPSRGRELADPSQGFRRRSPTPEARPSLRSTVVVPARSRESRAQPPPARDEDRDDHDRPVAPPVEVRRPHEGARATRWYERGSGSDNEDEDRRARD
jgi:hypothetical protein